jgi:hypothetical protein
MKLYSLFKDNGQLSIYPKVNEEVKLPMIMELFKNIYVVENK